MIYKQGTKMAQSRVQKGNGKKSKFPMWGIGIIVVLVVVIAGYAIVRFSQASTSHSYKTTKNGGLSGGDGNFTISKTSETIEFRKVLSTSPVIAQWAFPSGSTFYNQIQTGGEFGPNDKQMCARVYLSGNSIGTLTASVDTPFTPFNTLSKSKFETTTSDYSIRQVCVDISAVVSASLYITPLKAKVTVDKGTIGVSNIHLESQ
jgi:hypothetical protein